MIDGGVSEPICDQCGNYLSPNYICPNCDTPGSISSIIKGCTCAVIDNHGGKGFIVDNHDPQAKPMFWISGNCPLHGINKEKQND